MEDKKLIYQIIGLDSNFKYFYLVIISFLAFLDFLFSFLFSYQKPFLLVLKYNILILYFILAVIFPKLIPTSFKKFVQNSPEIFSKGSEQMKFEGAFDKEVESMSDKFLFFLFSLITIIFFIIFMVNHKDYFLFGTIRGSNAYLLIIDGITSIIALLFITTPCYLLYTIPSVLNKLGTTYKLKVDYQTLRSNKLKNITKWHFYGAGWFLILQIPPYLSTMIDEGLTNTVLISIFLLFFVRFLYILFDIKHIRDKIKKYKQEMKDNWLKLIQEEFEKPIPDYLKISSLEILLDKLKKTKNWPIGINFIWILQVVVNAYTVFQIILIFI